MSKPFAIVLDIETSGLEPDFDVILEIGMVLVNDQLEELSRFRRTINWPTIEFDQTTGVYEPPFGVHRTVVEMHTENGLWGESYRSNHTISSALHDGAVWLGQQLRDVDEKLPLAGNTIYFDRAFIYHADRNYFDNLHYRVIDISSIKMCYQAWTQRGDAPVGNKMHRAIPDCLDSIAEWKFYKKVLFDG